MKNILSFDVEDWYQGFVTRGIDGWQQYGSREGPNVNRVLELLEEHKTKATFFVLGQFAEQQPKTVRAVAEAGHEIATHGYAHRPLPSFSPSEFRNDLRHSIELLENIVGTRVIGHRAASWSMTRECLWALDILAEEGLLYDSSIFPSAYYKYSFPSFPAKPCRIETRPDLSIAEFPAQVLSVGPFRIPAAGGFPLRAMPARVSQWALRQSERKGTRGMVYLHPYDLDDKVPRLDVSFTFRMIRYYNLARTKKTLQALLTSFDFIPIRDALLDPALSLSSLKLSEIG